MSNNLDPSLSNPQPDQEALQASFDGIATLQQEQEAIWPNGTSPLEAFSVVSKTHLIGSPVAEQLVRLRRGISSLLSHTYSAVSAGTVRPNVNSNPQGMGREPITSPDIWPAHDSPNFGATLHEIFLARRSGQASGHTRTSITAADGRFKRLEIAHTQVPENTAEESPAWSMFAVTSAIDIERAPERLRSFIKRLSMRTILSIQQEQYTEYVLTHVNLLGITAAIDSRGVPRSNENSSNENVIGASPAIARRLHKTANLIGRLSTEMLVRTPLPS